MTETQKIETIVAQLSEAKGKLETGINQQLKNAQDLSQNAILNQGALKMAVEILASIENLNKADEAELVAEQIA